jgi:Uncharacterized protein conserved in bacteria (DUF2344)
VDRPSETAPGVGQPPAGDPRGTDSDPATGPAAPPPEVRQRWRLTYAREPVPADAVGRAAIDAWHAALVESGLPIAGLEPGGTGKPRLSLGAPLSATASGEAELADVFFLERRRLWEVREALAPRLPLGHRWVAAEDIWLGAPPLPGRVAAADWRVDVAPGPGSAETLDHAGLAAAIAALVAAPELPRVRMKGSSERRYDLRPLVLSLALEADGLDAGPARLAIRTLIHPELGSGRPEEIIAALGDGAGLPLEAVRIVRTRLVLVDDLARERAAALSPR